MFIQDFDDYNSPLASFLKLNLLHILQVLAYETNATIFFAFFLFGDHNHKPVEFMQSGIYGT